MSGCDAFCTRLVFMTEVTPAYVIKLDVILKDIVAPVTQKCYNQCELSLIHI